jgi:hypothetical protein
VWENLLHLEQVVVVIQVDSGEDNESPNERIFNVAQRLIHGMTERTAAKISATTHHKIELVMHTEKQNNNRVTKLEAPVHSYR